MPHVVVRVQGVDVADGEPRLRHLAEHLEGVRIVVEDPRVEAAHIGSASESGSAARGQLLVELRDLLLHLRLRRVTQRGLSKASRERRTRGVHGRLVPLHLIQDEEMFGTPLGQFGDALKQVVNDGCNVRTLAVPEVVLANSLNKNRKLFLR